MNAAMIGFLMGLSFLNLIIGSLITVLGIGPKEERLDGQRNMYLLSIEFGVLAIAMLLVMKL